MTQDYICEQAGGPELSRHCIQIPSRHQHCACDALRHRVITQTHPTRPPAFFCTYIILIFVQTTLVYYASHLQTLFKIKPARLQSSVSSTITHQNKIVLQFFITDLHDRFVTLSLALSACKDRFLISLCRQ